MTEHQQSSSTSIPLILILDLDGTIIGDITPQIMSYELSKALKTVTSNKDSKYVFDMTEFKSKLTHGLIRPYFEVFVKSLLNNIANVEFFVYTASEKSWAELMIKTIEQCIGVKFNRPIFSRQYCVSQDKQYKKSLRFIGPTLTRSLKKKYGVTFSQKDLSSNILIIDNNNVYHSFDQRQLIVCPSYNYRVAENIVCHIKSKMFKAHNVLITSILKKYIPIGQPHDFNTFQKQFYIYYIAFLEQVIKNNAHYSQDKFWLYLKDIILSQNIRRFDEKSVKFITNVLRQRLGTQSAQPNPNLQHTQHAHTKKHELQPTASFMYKKPISSFF